MEPFALTVSLDMRRSLRACLWFLAAGAFAGLSFALPTIQSIFGG